VVNGDLFVELVERTWKSPTMNKCREYSGKRAGGQGEGL
jgi:hypothetical protein